MSGELKKLKIEAYSTIEFKESDKVDEFSVLFNPSTYAQKYEVTYENNAGQGTTGNTQKFGRIKPQEYSFDFLFDGTGTAAPATDVASAIDQFLKVTGKMDGDIHRPLFLKLSWGNLLSKCVLKTADITYTLFRPDGFPLRAKVTAQFSEAIDDTLRVAEEGKNSPDLTHVRAAQEGDRLDLMAYRIYGDPATYTAVARANDLDHFRALPAGLTLRFPPMIQLPEEDPANA